ncbi:MAG: hypothetical protein VKJ46_09595, partial [Leptolyngbyaceae bacterium]|nr:hypothetical protein [Leptolyngbyaceae bacterium]
MCRPFLPLPPRRFHSMTRQPSRLTFPLWQFLNQPVFSSTSRLILNPRQFWYVYRIQLLKRCWAKNFESEGHHHH